MLYHVTRQGQTYGPYTLEDLQRYVAGGNVLPTDLARSEQMSEWLPVSQILGGMTSAFAQPATPAPAGYTPYPAAAAGAWPAPPNLHWAPVLIIGFFTCGLFWIIWAIVQSIWMRKVVPQSKALFYYIAGFLVSFIGNFIRMMLLFSAGGLHRAYGPYRPYGPALGVGFIGSGLLIFIVYVTLLELAFFDMSSSMEQHYNTSEPIGLSLNPAMTFFFGIFYFQHHFSRINEMKRMAHYGAPPLR